MLRHRILRHRIYVAILSCLMVIAPCRWLPYVWAEEAEASPAAPADANDHSNAVTNRLVDELAKKKWLANGQCVACHFKVPSDVHGVQVGQADLDLTHPDLSAANFLLLGLSNTRQQQACVNCHEQTGEAKAPCKRADRCTRDAEARQKVTYLGVGVEPVPQAVREHVKLPKDVGLMVETVEPDSPAARADLRRYDILEKLDGQLLINQGQFGVLVRTYPPEHAISLELIRANERKTMSAKLGQRAVIGSTHDGFTDLDIVVGQKGVAFVDVGAADSAVSKGIEFLQRVQSTRDEGVSQPEPAPVTYLGITTSPPPAALAEQLKLPPERCLIIDSVEADSPASAAGLKAFDVVEKLDDQLIVNSEQLTVLVRLRKPGEEVTLTLIREGKLLKVTVKLGAHGTALYESNQVLDTVLGDLDYDGDGEVVNLMRGDRLIRRYVDVGQGKFYEIDQTNQMLDDVLTFTAGTNDVSDQEYLRRVFLDLTGTLPPAEDVAEFTADDRPDKRKRLVNRLLSRPEVISALGDKAVLQWADDEHSLTLTTADSGQKRLTAKDREGKVLFEGPVTDEQRQKLEPRLAMKVALMLKGYIGAPAEDATDSNALLEKVLPRFSASGGSLKKVIDELRQATGANIVVDWKSLARSGIAADEPLELDLHDVRLRTVLKTLLSLAGNEKGRLQYTVEDGVILIAAEDAR